MCATDKRSVAHFCVPFVICFEKTGKWNGKNDTKRERKIKFQKNTLVWCYQRLMGNGRWRWEGKEEEKFMKIFKVFFLFLPRLNLFLCFLSRWVTSEIPFAIDSGLFVFIVCRLTIFLHNWRRAMWKMFAERVEDEVTTPKRYRALIYFLFIISIPSHVYTEHPLDCPPRWVDETSANWLILKSSYKTENSFTQALPDCP